MLYKIRCPQTGVINLFLEDEPRLAAGSVSRKGKRRFVWRCHIADDLNGVADDVGLAEAYLRVAIADHRRGQDTSTNS